MNTKLQFFLNYLTKTLLISMVGLFLIPGKAIARPANNDTPISIEVENASITEVFSTIEAKTGYTFVFDESISRSKHSFTFQFTMLKYSLLNCMVK